MVDFSVIKSQKYMPPENQVSLAAGELKSKFSSLTLQNAKKDNG